VRRPGVSIRARKGYWAALPISAARSGDPAGSWSGTNALPFASQFPRRTSPLIRPWFGMARADGGATRVSFVWEPAPPVPGERRKGLGPSRIALLVTKLDGTLVYDGVVLASDRGVAPVPDARTRASFEVPAGRLLVQMRIEDATAAVVDRDVRDLVVREFGGPVAIGTAEILRARNARDVQALATDPNAAPVASRQFSRGERLIVRTAVSSAGGTPVVTARLVSGLGGVMRPLTVVGAPSRPSEYQTEVALAGLAVGTYSVELIATSSAGEAREIVAFRVTP
jgi:hypothetical protein